MIEFKNINFTFTGKTIIDNFSDNIDNGEHVCIMGESGAGKSTLLNSIVGLTIPTSGEIIINEKPINSNNIHKIRSEIAWVPQEINLPYDFVHQTIEAPFLLKANKSIVFDKNRLFELFSKVGLDEKLYNQPMREISGGERQRIMLVTALMLHKNIILLDEPTSALDALTRSKLSDLFKQINDITIVAITHDEQFAKSFDRVITLKKL